jgi:hypothetical protein
MSRNAAARGRRPNTEAWLAVCDRVERDEDPWQEPEEQLREENARLRDQVADVEGWYRLLQAEHFTLQDNDRRNSRRTTELQAEVNRLDGENHDLRGLVARLVDTAPVIQEPREGSSMTRIGTVFRTLQRNKWATAALVTIATLLARDATVHGVFAGVAAKARQAAGFDRDGARAPAESGFVRYAAMINSRDQLERARKEYNEGEGRLKGDALLEAQDRLRAAKARDREARLAFLPELARQCEQAKVGIPREAAEALAALKSGTDE